MSPAEQFIKWTREARARRASARREQHDIIRNCKPELRHKLLVVVRRVNRNHDARLPRLSRATLRAEARGLLAFSRTPIRDYSTEYYSTCGLDDAQSDARQAAAEHAQLLLAVVSLLGTARRSSTNA